MFVGKARAQCYKTFFVRDLRIFVLSLSVCYTRLLKLANDKHSSLVRKSVNHGQTKFYNIGPRGSPDPALLENIRLHLKYIISTIYKLKP